MRRGPGWGTARGARCRPLPRSPGGTTPDLALPHGPEARVAPAQGAGTPQQGHHRYTERGPRSLGGFTATLSRGHAAAKPRPSSAASCTRRRVGSAGLGDTRTPTHPPPGCSETWDEEDEGAEEVASACGASARPGGRATGRWSLPPSGLRLPQHPQAKHGGGCWSTPAMGARDPDPSSRVCLGSRLGSWCRLEVGRPKGAIGAAAGSCRAKPRRVGTHTKQIVGTSRDGDGAATGTEQPQGRSRDGWSSDGTEQGQGCGWNSDRDGAGTIRRQEKGGGRLLTDGNDTIQRDAQSCWTVSTGEGPWLRVPSPRPEHPPAPPLCLPHGNGDHAGSSWALAGGGTFLPRAPSPCEGDLGAAATTLPASAAASSATAAQKHPPGREGEVCPLPPHATGTSPSCHRGVTSLPQECSKAVGDLRGTRCPQQGVRHRQRDAAG